MKLSQSTIQTLKTFTTINTGVVLKPGRVQRTISADVKIMLEVELEDSFDVQFPIYSLSTFLANLSNLKDPDLEFNEKFVTMKDDTFSIKLYSCDPNLIRTPPDKDLVLADPDVTFDISGEIISKMTKFISTNGFSHISFIGENGELRIHTHERENDTTDSVSSKITDYTGPNVSFHFVADHFKIIPDDYEVSIKSKAFAKFKSKTKPGTIYNISLEAVK
jgi:hypothetical protein